MSLIYSTNQRLAKNEPRNDIYWWDDYDDFRPHFGSGPFIPDLTVFEEDKEPEISPTGLLAPNGTPIMAIREHPGMDFIGFIPPWELERITQEREKAEVLTRKKKGVRRASARKSKA